MVALYANAIAVVNTELFDAALDTRNTTCYTLYSMKQQGTMTYGRLGGIMKRTIILIALLMATPLAAQEKPEESKLFRIMGWATYGASAGDLITTEIGLSQGAVELNPIQRHCITRCTTHAVMPPLLNYGTAKLYHAGHEKAALWIRIATVVGYGYLISHNLRQY